jgi:hypothetical protein
LQGKQSHLGRTHGKKENDMGANKWVDDNGDEVKQKWHGNPVITAIVSALLTGAMSLAFFTFTRGIDNSTAISGDSAKINALQEQVDALKEQIGQLQTSIEGGYVSQSTFSEFKARYETDQSKLQANDSRIENKLDILIMEHAKPTKATTFAASNELPKQ